MNTQSILQLKNVHYRVSSASDVEEEVVILKGCALSVEPGERVAIVGRSGSGKSTLLALMAGLDSPTEGGITLLGQSLEHLDENQRARLRAQKVGFVFQNFQLMPGMNALENVMMPLELFGVSNAREQASEALERVDLSHRLYHAPNALSGGEQQRVAIARALVSKPKIVFADEPTGNLDEVTAHRVQDLLLNLQSEASLILVTHDRNFANRCQRVLDLQDGRLMEQKL